MEKPHINIVLLPILLAVTSVAAVPEQFYFQIIEYPESIDCFDQVARVSTTTSAIKCCADCSKNSQCRGVMFDLVTMDCKEVHKTTALEDKTCKADIGTVYYAPEVCGQYLVSGTRPVEDDQLSESSRWCDLNLSKSFCQPPEMRYLAAKYARLNSTGLYTGGWATAVVNQHQYVQVDFRKETVVTGVVLQSRDPAYNAFDNRPIEQYVTLFKVLYSQDCSTYKEFKNDNGNTLIFEGNSRYNETIFRDLPRKVKARCFRINPVEWFYFISMRIDLLGCL